MCTSSPISIGEPVNNLQLSEHGIWYFRKVYTLSSGKRKEIKKSLRTRDKKIAKQKVHALLSCVVSQRTAPQEDPAVIDFQKELKRYLAYKTPLVAEREVKSIERFVIRYLSFTTDPLSKKQAFNFIDSLKEASVATKNKHTSKISGFFHWMSKHHDTEIRNPFEGLKLKDVRAAKDHRQAYTESQVKQLKRALPSLEIHKQWIIKLALFTGMRGNEIVQLSTDDIKQVDGVWCIKVGDDLPWQTVKNASSKRLIPLSKALHGFLAYVSEIPRHTRVFPQFKPYKGNCAHYFSKWFKRWRATNGLPEFHSIRHYVATKLKSSGIPVQYAATLLGHSNGNITYDRYGKDVAPKHLIECINTL